MSTFIVVVVVGACTWVVFRAATQPVEPATAGAGATRAPAPRRTRPPKPRPARPLPPVAAPPPLLAPEVLPPPVLPPPVLPPVPDVDLEEPDEPDELDELDEEVIDDEQDVDDDDDDEALVAVVAPPKRRTGPRSDPGEPARPATFLERARSGALLVVLAVVLGGAVALAIGLAMLVLFNLLRGAVG